MSSLGARIVRDLAESAGLSVRFLDFAAERGRGRTIPIPPAIGHLRQYLVSGETGRASFFTNYRRFGPDFAECAARIADDSPDLVLIGCFAFAYADDTVELARELRRLLPGAVITVGGAGATVLPGYFLKPDPSEPAPIDHVIAGEAETVLPGYIRSLRQGDDLSRIPGIHTAEHPEGAIPARRTVSEELPCAWAALPLSRNVTTVSLSLSRGCGRSCAFCSNRLCHGSVPRTVPPSRIAAAVGRFPKTGRLIVNFEDDNLLDHWDLLMRVVGSIRAAHPGVGFRAENGLDYRCLDGGKSALLAEWGFDAIGFSLVSADPELLRGEGRSGGYEELASRVRELTLLGVPSTVHFIAGLRGDTPESTVRTIAAIHGTKAACGISMFYPVPGIRGFEDPTPFMAGPSHRCAGSSAYPWTGSLTTAQLVTAFRLSRLSNLMRMPVRSPEEDILIGRTVSSGSRLYTLVSRSGKIEAVPLEGLDEGMTAGFLASLSS